MRRISPSGLRGGSRAPARGLPWNPSRVVCCSSPCPAVPSGTHKFSTLETSQYSLQTFTDIYFLNYFSQIYIFKIIFKILFTSKLHSTHSGAHEGHRPRPGGSITARPGSDWPPAGASWPGLSRRAGGCGGSDGDGGASCCGPAARAGRTAAAAAVGWLAAAPHSSDSLLHDKLTRPHD
eukprot:SAG22_NODE_4819_length_1157_cov_2.774102_1_plen_178_part_10